MHITIFTSAAFCVLGTTPHNLRATPQKECWGEVQWQSTCLSLRAPEFHLSIHTKKEQKLKSTVLNNKFKIFCFRIKRTLWCLLWMCYVGNEGVHVCVSPRHHNVFKDSKSTRCGDFNGTVLVTLSYLAQKANTECFICILTININSQIC